MTASSDDFTPSWLIDPADPDAAELHETWQTLGQALGASAAPLDDVAAARLVRGVLRREERRRQRRWGVAALCAAAVVLFLVGKPRLSPENALPVAQQNPSPTEALPATSLAWNDPWDQELAAVREQVLAVQLDWSRSDDAFDDFGERLQALETEWSESPL